MDYNLKKFLLRLPKESNFEIHENIRKQIRKELFLSVTNGKYLDWLFPDIPNLIDKLENEFNWKYSNYSKSLAIKRGVQDTHSHNAFHPHQPCSRIFHKGEPIFRCLTCSYDETCALCSHCYQPSEHDGHDVHIGICLRENGGVCDCGDPEAWVRDFKCPYALNELNFQDQILPDEFYDSILKTISDALDFIIDVMIHSDLQLDDIEEMNVDTVLKNTKYSTFNAHKYHDCGFEDIHNDKYCLILYNDQIRHYRDAVQRVYLASRKFKDFAIMITDQVQIFGKAEVIISADIPLLLERQRLLSSTGLTTSIRSTRDVFREEMCHELIVWLNEFTESEFFKINTTVKQLFDRAFCSKWRCGLQNKGDFTEKYSTGHLQPNLSIPQISTKHYDTLWIDECQENIHCDNCGQTEVSEIDIHGSRLQYMIFLDIRFWKAARSLLHDMYSTSLITSLKYKHIISSQYIEIYAVVADMFLSIDREPELNVMSKLSTQLFTSPGNSKSIIHHGDFISILASVHSFLTSERIQFDDHSIHEISLKSLKNRRWGHLFFDISFIISRGKKSYDVLDKESVAAICDVLDLFQGRPAMRREKTNHVEYESPDYSSFFQSIPVIYKFAEMSAETVDYTEMDISYKQERALSAIHYVINYLINLETHLIPGINYENTDIQLSGDFLQDPISKQIIKSSKVSEDSVSFLHPTHSFLSCLIEYAKFSNLDKLKAIFKEIQAPKFPGVSIESLIFDYPIKTIVLMSQIKAGFWVRNGFNVKSQLHLYKNTGLRDNGYIRDYFFTQIFMSICDSDFATFLTLDRWSLGLNWDLHSESIYDEKTLPYMIEECVNFFIYVMTEDLHLKGMTEAEVTRTKVKREIIHNLCFGPLNYKKLSSQMPDRVIADKRFDIILGEMTTYKKPTGASDSGIFQLKEKYLDEVDPYYFNYTTNTRDDALKLVKDRIKRKTGKPLSEIVIHPKQIDSNILPIYRNIGNFSSSVHFVTFIMKALIYVQLHELHQHECLLETTLHLIHICCGAGGASFYQQFMSYNSNFKLSLNQLLFNFLKDENFKIGHCKIRAIYADMSKMHTTFESDMRSQIKDIDFDFISLNSYDSASNDELARKRLIAKKKQEQLMAKFKKQQTKFLENNQNESTEGSDIEMEDYELKHGWKFPDAHCILCQNVGEELGPFGIIAYINQSTTFRKVPFNDDYWFLKSFSDAANLNSGFSSDYEYKTKNWEYFMDTVKDDFTFGPGFKSDGCVESKLVSSSCGHGMHFQCYLNYMDNNRPRQSQITRNTPEGSNSKDILCPLCKSASNIFIPILSKYNDKSLSQYLTPSNSSPFQAFSINEEFLSKLSKYALMESLPNFDHKDYDNVLNNFNQTITSITFPRFYESDSSYILSNSIKSSEIALRGVSSHGFLVIEQLTNNTLINLRTLNEFRLANLRLKFESSQEEDAQAKFLSYILLLTDEVNSTILEADFFELLVEIISCPSINFSFNSILRQIFTCHIIQCLNILAKELRRNWTFTVQDIPKLHDISSNVSVAARECLKMIDSVDIDGGIAYTMLVKSITPFLRRAAIFAFVQCANTEKVNVKVRKSELEADALSRFLNIPTVSDILLTLLNSQLFYNFVHTSSNIPHVEKELEYPGIIRLIDLPDRLDLFFSKYYYSDRFNNPHQFIEDPAICLFCAQVVDLQKQAIGCDDGQCTTHYLRECNSNVGMFLLPKDRTILLLNKNGGSFYNAPFLDEQGALADENKKGKALHLMKPRYDDFIRNVWLQHDVSNYIARTLESTADAGGWNSL
ncbi:uncharacterized protein KGF55_001119 [Candida pseudojiufengensis]|uniref:uncharacterized protein n=1 Tax=Candida pseudojiufengensis TaxID=497109 RepID=UPI00222432D0|nr:uncharacterized protein KGF55_001119 [Candida pseudojiufengensis]KAI5965756.1 hypothetical protein KGF55_001119 [Candida pseudojiufengensis]